MRKLILLAHISLDGFVAGTNGDLDNFDASDENLAFVTQLTENADTALCGRLSYEMIDKYWPTAKERANATQAEIAFSNWYNGATKIVFSKTLSTENLSNTIIINNIISSEIIKIKEEEGKDILIFGSPSIAQILMQSYLIDSYWIFINPVIFGKGIPLFTEQTNILKFKILSTKQFANGELAINYVGENRL